MSEILSEIIMKYPTRYDKMPPTILGSRPSKDPSPSQWILLDTVYPWHKESENPNFHWRQICILIPKWILYIVLTRLTDARFMTIKDQWIPASRRVRKVDNTEAKRWMPWFWPRARRVGLTRNGFNGRAFIGINNAWTWKCGLSASPKILSILWVMIPTLDNVYDDFKATIRYHYFPVFAGTISSKCTKTPDSIDS